MPEYNDHRISRPGDRSVPCQVVAAAAAIRETPEPAGRTSTYALHGEVVDVFERRDKFGHVQCRRDRYTGWIEMDAIASPALAPTHKIKVLRTFAFSEPDLKSSPAMVLSLGSLVATTGRRDGVWVECDHAGWIHEAHFALLDRFEYDPAGVALRYLETPYLWGGRDSIGIDCSGLVQQAFEACGVLIPRDTDMQAAWAGELLPEMTQNVPLSRGDLVFWRGHVGILTAPDTLLHANAHHMMVAEEPLKEAITRIAGTAGPVTAIRRLNLGRDRGRTPDWLRNGV